MNGDGGNGGIWKGRTRTVGGVIRADVWRADGKEGMQKFVSLYLNSAVQAWNNWQISCIHRLLTKLVRSWVNVGPDRNSWLPLPCKVLSLENTCKHCKSVVNLINILPIHELIQLQMMQIHILS